LDAAVTRTPAAVACMNLPTQITSNYSYIDMIDPIIAKMLKPITTFLLLFLVMGLPMTDPTAIPAIEQVYKIVALLVFSSSLQSS
jgi:hypothetical protein